MAGALASSQTRNERRHGRTAVESGKPVGNGKRMNTRKTMDSYRSGARIQGSSTTYLYPANTGEVGHGLEVRESVV